MIGAYSLLICKFTNDRGLIPFRRLVQLRAGGSDAKTRHVLRSQRVGKTSPVLSFIVSFLKQSLPVLQRNSRASSLPLPLCRLEDTKMTARLWSQFSSTDPPVADLLLMSAAAPEWRV